MSSAWARLVAALAHREPGTALACFRIAIGATLTVELLTTWASGAMAFLWYPLSDGGFRASVTSDHWLFGLLGARVTAPQIDAVFTVALGCAVLVTLGVGTRAAAAVALVCVQALFDLQPASGGGHDRVLTIALFGLIVAASDTTLSLACRVRTGAWTSQELVPAWPRYVGIWQLTLMYVGAGSVKLNAQWIDPRQADAVYRFLLQPTWMRVDLAGWLAPVVDLTRAASFVTAVWEVSFFVVPLALLWRAAGRSLRLDPRPLYVGIGVGVHGTLWVLANLGPFSPVTMSFYALLFGPGLLRGEQEAQ